MKRSIPKVLLIWLFLTVAFAADSFGQQADSTIYISVDSCPSFRYKNCRVADDCIKQFISEHLVWPDVESDMYVKVLVQVVVEKDGTLSNIRVVRGVEEWFNRKAVEIVQSMPKWTPGKKGNKIVRTQLTFPVVWQ